LSMTNGTRPLYVKLYYSKWKLGNIPQLPYVVTHT
jgi:hypothetical protein